MYHYNPQQYYKNKVFLSIDVKFCARRLKLQ